MTRVFLYHYGKDIKKTQHFLVTMLKQRSVTLMRASLPDTRLKGKIAIILLKALR